MRHVYGLVGCVLASLMSAGLTLTLRIDSGLQSDPRVDVLAIDATDQAPRPERAADRWLREQAAYPRITFRGTLLANSPHVGAECGVFYWHQVARYRVEEVTSGRYTASTIVVDHPACFGDVFEGWKAGDRIRLTVSVQPDYSSITCHPGIRDEPGVAGPFYIADGRIERD